jgi:cysteinyl-tRNA synthetase
MTDLMRRTLDYLGYNVNFGMSIIDVDNRVAGMADLIKIKTDDVAQKYVKLFIKDCAKLNIKIPTRIIKISDNIKEIITNIQKLVDKGYGKKKENCIVFNPQKYDKDKIKQITFKFKSKEDSVIEDEDNEGKEFILWKIKNKKEHGWDSPFGYGIPGKHIINASLARIMFDTVDIYTGNENLTTQQHINEFMIHNCLDFGTDKQFINKYLNINNVFNEEDEKITNKTNSNISIEELLKNYSVDDLRFYFMSHDYKKPIIFDKDMLDNSKRLKDYIFSFLNNYSKEYILEKKLVVNNQNMCDEYHTYMKNISNILMEDFNLAYFICDIQNTIYSISYDRYNMYEVIDFIQKIKFIFHTLGFDVHDTATHEEIGEKIDCFRKEMYQNFSSENNIDKLKDKLIKSSNRLRENLKYAGVKLVDIKLNNGNSKLYNNEFSFKNNTIAKTREEQLKLDFVSLFKGSSEEDIRNQLEDDYDEDFIDDIVDKVKVMKCERDKICAESTAIAESIQKIAKQKLEEDKLQKECNTKNIKTNTKPKKIIQKKDVAKKEVTKKEITKKNVAKKEITKKEEPIKEELEKEELEKEELVKKKPKKLVTKKKQVHKKVEK